MDKSVGNKGPVWRLAAAGILLALLVAWQAATAPIGITILTGSGVNLILAVAAIAVGARYGALISLISPVAAKLVGIGPLWEIIPFIALGNIVLVLIWHFLGKGSRSYARLGLTAVVAAAVKFAVLYLGIVRIMIPLVLELPEKQTGVISATFSVPQLITALIGGVLAVLARPLIARALGSGRER
ncbi:MAG: hypothetical protein LBT12_02010 [Oscillospiraceae bacterium]|jgi:hypothetical protein|nr:hypothetical protein [Oscillospiraceae bacterium]